ncbi:pentatricopeptide repeat domain-containing protein [Poronia punctata]|nr:pentatricopeptide repeat domain-containing protein [Poronia punctata]
MRSQVTRHVLRRPPAVRGVATLSVATTNPRPCLASANRPTVHRYPIGPRGSRIPQRRFLFNLLQKPPRVLKEIEAEPGYETLLTYRAAQNNNLRPPPLSDLSKAWRDFFGYKFKHRRVVNSTQAACAQGVLNHLCRPLNVDNAGLAIGDLFQALRCLERQPRDDTTQHLELARSLFREIRRRELGIEAGRSDAIGSNYRLKDSQSQLKHVHSFLTILSKYGRALEARDIYLSTLPDSGPITSSDSGPSHNLLPVASGLAAEGREDELRQLAHKVLDSGVMYDPRVHQVMTSFFAQQNNFEETKSWWSRPIREGSYPQARTYYDVLQFSLRNDKGDWAMEIYQDLISRLESGAFKEPKAYWDVSFQYAYLLLGKGIDQIEHMFKVVSDRSNSARGQPTIGSINGLVRCAIDKGDPYMAERFISLSEKLGFSPDMTTYILQLEYRLRANDLDGAFASFQGMRHLDTDSKEREIPALNRLIRGYCTSVRPDYEKILEVTSYLEQRHVTLEPETVVAICMAFLKNDEMYEVIDTLSLHTAHYSIAERRMVRKAFVEYCLDKKNSTARVWDAYALLRQFFPETENEDRVAIMDAFFDRRRPDMACHVFGHMRSHENIVHRPTVDTYVRCFEGLGRCPDTTSMKMIHNMSKMDTTIQPETRLYNALMIGYIACDEAHRALDFWKEITTSPEGPSYASLEIAFRAYEVQPYGDTPAKELWARIMRMDIDVPDNVYTAYVTTLAAHSHLPEAKVLIDDHDKIIGKRPDASTFAYIYNALPSKEMKDDFEAWAQHEYPPLWESLTKKHRRRPDEDGLLQFKVSRPWKA